MTEEVNCIELKMTPGELLPQVEVRPFVRVVWHGPDIMNKWKPLYSRAASLHHRVEYEMVKRHNRKAATLHLSNSNFDVELERIQKDGLVWLPIQRTKAYSGFSHRHFPTSSNDPNSTVYGVLAVDMESAQAFKNASHGKVDHGTIGELLGFPKCCHDFFIEVWDSGFIDPMWQAAERTKEIKYLTDKHCEVKGSILCSQLLRYCGHRVTSHLPCSLDCEASREIGKVWWETGGDVDGEAAEALLRIMSLKQSWSVNHGVAVIETPVFTVWTNSLVTKSKWQIDYTPTDRKELMEVIM